MTPPLIDELDKILQLKDRGPLLQALETLAQDTSFYNLADVWGYALLERNPAFFEPFLIRHLPRAPLPILKTLLPRIETSGREQLFAELYPLLISEERWNQEIEQILAADFSTTQKDAMLMRRMTASVRWYTLTEENAFALYQNSPVKFTPILKLHVRRSWWRDKRAYKKLRDAAGQQGDEELQWYLFREFASQKEWHRSLKGLLKSPPTPETISAELAKRHPRYGWDYKTSIVARFLLHYGDAVVPYVEEHLYWLNRHDRDKLMRALTAIQDENSYWRLFFKVATNDMWLEQIRAALKQAQTTDELYRLIQRRTPPSDETSLWQRWAINDAFALALYQRDAQRFRPFIERFFDQRGYGSDEGTALFEAAAEWGDEDLLNFLSFAYLRQTSDLAWRQQNRWAQKNKKDEQRLQELSRLLIGRFNRLYAQSPQLYVRHVADTLSRYRAFEVWNFEVQLNHNPAFGYIFHHRREAWRESAVGIRELLESTNIFVQILGLEILAAGGWTAAERVVENRLVLRALLLGRARKKTKRLALQALEQAALQDPIFAEQILPLLEETMAFQSRKSIGDDIMVSLVRCQERAELSMKYEV